MPSGICLILSCYRKSWKAPLAPMREAQRLVPLTPEHTLLRNRRGMRKAEEIRRIVCRKLIAVNPQYRSSNQVDITVHLCEIRPDYLSREDLARGEQAASLPDE